MYSAKTKTLTKRVIGQPHTILVSDQGDVSNHEVTVWRGDKRARRWVTVQVNGNHPKRNLIVSADHLSLKGNNIVAEHGTSTTIIEAEPFEPQTRKDGVPDVLKQPEGKSFVLDSFRRENLQAIHALYPAMSHDRSLPMLATVHVASSGSETVQATSTDRYRAVRATMHTASKPVAFEAQVKRNLIYELTINSAWHLTVHEDQSVAQFCDTGVRVQCLNVTSPNSAYPKVDELFTRDRKSEPSVEWTVTPALMARVLRDLNPPRNTSVGISSDGLMACQGSGEFKPAGLIETSVQGDPPAWVSVNPVFLEEQLRSVRKFREAVIWWGEKSTDGSLRPIFVNVGEGIEVLMMPTRDAGSGAAFPVANEIEY